jgi:hypothetical protein
MELFHHVTVLLINQEEKRAFAEAGIRFRETMRGSCGESASFYIADADERWPKVAALLASVEPRDGLTREQRVMDLKMTAPTFEESVAKVKSRLAERLKSPPGMAWLSGYSGQTTAELLSLEGQYRIDSLVLAFEEGIQRKGARDGSANLTDEERMVLAVEALEREVNNGGYDQFFINTSREYAPIIVAALERIGCKKTARITEKALKALHAPEATGEAIEAVIYKEDARRDATLSKCNAEYYESAEPIADRLFAFLKANPKSIRL